MLNYIEISKLFEERAQGIDFYENAEVTSLKNRLQNILQNNSKQLLFLIGEPGVGKSAFLNNLENLLEKKYNIINFDTPFIEPAEFVKILIKKSKNEPLEVSLQEMIAQVVDIYKDKDYIITIDEAQLLTKNMIELLRILSDSKAFWFLIAMHKHESESILKEPHFSSRPHKILELGKLKKSECKEFIYSQLAKKNLNPLADEIIKKHLNFIYKITKGNFRNIKKLMFNSFILMDEAAKLNKPKYQKISRCLLTMAAINGEMIDV